MPLRGSGLGNGGASPSDRLSGISIAGGNFTVTSSCSAVELVPYYCDLDGDGSGCPARS
jgi:hypothetical protein